MILALVTSGDYNYRKCVLQQFDCINESLFKYPETNGRHEKPCIHFENPLIIMTGDSDHSGINIPLEIEIYDIRDHSKQWHIVVSHDEIVDFCGYKHYKSQRDNGSARIRHTFMG